jgi:GT2 family glycosyltransferase
MNSRKYQVAVILVNYNSSQYTLDCVQSIQKQTTGIRYQIVITDNNSRPEERTKLSALDGLQDVQLIFSPENLGFSGANMLGVKSADADYYFFLNNDCVLLNDCLRILHDFMTGHPEAANASGEMFIADGSYEYNFRYFPSIALKLLGSGILRIFKPDGFPSRHIRFQQPTAVDLVNGSSMFIRAIPFEKINGFDTKYFLYCEEEDIALRLRREGFLTYLVPAARYQHFVSRSTRQEGSINLPFLKEFYISFLYYFGKNYNITYRLIIQLFYVVKTGRKALRNREFGQLAWFILRGAPEKESLRYQSVRKA